MTAAQPWSGTRTLGRSGLEVSALGLGGWAIGGAMAVGGQELGYASWTTTRPGRGSAVPSSSASRCSTSPTSTGPGTASGCSARCCTTPPDVRVATTFGNTIDETRWGVSTDDPVVARRSADAPHCTAMQLGLNVLDDNPAMLQVCDDHDLAALCRSPLAMGLLGGRYGATSTVPAGDIRAAQPGWLRWFADGRPEPAYLAAVDAVRSALTEDGRSLAQGALGWIWAHHPRAILLPGFRDTTQVDDNAGALARGPLEPDSYAAVQVARPGAAADGSTSG